MEEARTEGRQNSFTRKVTRLETGGTRAAVTESW